MTIHKLKALQVDKVKTEGMMGDGGGLYLNIKKTGSKSWIYRYKINGKSVEMGLGSYPVISLSEAREYATKWRKCKAEGKDPIRVRDSEELSESTKHKDKTFRECATDYIEAHRSGWTNKKHAQQWSNTLATYAYKHIGDIIVEDIDVSHILGVLTPIWGSKTETATRVRQRIECILDWAIVHEYRKSANPARWKGYMDKLLPKPSKIASVQHHAALPYTQIGELVASIRKHNSVKAKALEFVILTGLRTDEVLSASWDEIDLDSNIWVIPKERMKMNKEHKCPLSTGAQKIISDLVTIDDNPYLFFGQKPGKPICNAMMRLFLQTPVPKNGLGHANITVHGFRSTFRDWAAEKTDYPREVCELALAHDTRSEVELAYQRGDLLDKRRELMQAWSDYIDNEVMALKEIREV